MSHFMSLSITWFQIILSRYRCSTNACTINPHTHPAKDKNHDAKVFFKLAGRSHQEAKWIEFSRTP